MKVRTLSFVLYDWYSQHSRKRPPLMQDKVVGYAERWSSTGKKKEEIKLKPKWFERDYIKLLPNKQKLRQTDNCQCLEPNGA